MKLKIEGSVESSFKNRLDFVVVRKGFNIENWLFIKLLEEVKICRLEKVMVIF